MVQQRQRQQQSSSSSSSSSAASGTRWLCCMAGYLITALASVAADEEGGPCDILKAAGNPCVAAHSTTRALYAKYDGALYNVTRSSDGSTKSIGVLRPGGFADIKEHEQFCAELDCVISHVLDQSSQGNHLGPRHKLVNASQHKITVGSAKTPVFGMWFDPGYGYHVDNTTGIAKGNAPESIFAVMSGTHFNGGCCFDYGNSETNDRDDGCGTMEAIYFGNAHWHGNSGNGSGPWVGADLEQGMYYGGGERTQHNPDSQSLPFEFVTVSLRGRTDGFVLKGGDATGGPLMTQYDGPRPDRKIAGTCGKVDSYQPMRKQGAIILATGGDFSNSGMGKFYEGFMVTGATSDETDAKVQANIVAVGYKIIPKPCEGTVGNALCGCADDGNKFQLACPKNGTITAVTFAAVGTPGGKCGHLTIDPKCNGNMSLAAAYVERTCVGKTNCELDADINTFNAGRDPCLGVPKHAEVQVVCSP